MPESVGSDGPQLARPAEEGEPMKYIVEPQKDETQERGCPKFITLCAQCSENPRFCDEF